MTETTQPDQHHLPPEPERIYPLIRGTGLIYRFRNDLGGMLSVALFSADERYRYALVREWNAALDKLVVIGLNPSTADEVVNDPTVTRCVKRANSLMCGGLVMLNLFAWRATDPMGMRAQVDPIGSMNDAVLLAMAVKRPVVLAAWGNNGILRNRAQFVTDLLISAGVTLHSLAVTELGQPQHPLYIPYSKAPSVWRAPGRPAAPQG
jgi:hypothetical protein